MLSLDFLYDFLTVLLAVSVIVLIYIKWKYKYWEKKGIIFLQPSIPTGDLQNSFSLKESFAEMVMHRYKYAREHAQRHIGLYMFWSPTYVPVDPDIVRSILAKDFNYFSDRGFYYNEEDDPISAHLFALDSKDWRPLRAKLTPTFTSGKMKAMLDTVITCAHHMKDAMDEMVGRDPIDIKSVLGNFTMNVIGSCAFGLECNCFKDPNSDFIKYAKLAIQPLWYEEMRNFFTLAFPQMGRLLRLRATNSKVAKFFLDVTKESLDYRKKNGVVRNDFLELMVQLKNNKSLTDGKQPNENDGLTLDEIASQAFLFFLAGYETSSSTMAFCLYELALDNDIQEKLREEVNEVLKNHDDKITYEGINEMKYLSQVVDETLRKYPPLPVLNRTSIAEYKVPGTSVVLEKGTIVIIPNQGLQNDPEYFPDPERFDPERFSEENRHNIVPFTYLPFGDGPRNCIGLRFGLMQTKVGLIMMLKNYSFSFSNKTKTPIKMDPRVFTLSVLGDIWLDVSKIN